MTTKINKLDFLIENKKEIDLAFLEMLVKIKFLFTEQTKEENIKWLETAINEYEQIKCKGCCQE